MPVSDSLFQALAQARARPDPWARALYAGGDAAQGILEGYLKGQQIGDLNRKRELERQTLSDALGGKPLDEGLMNLTGESGAIQHPNIAAAIALLKAKKEASQKGTQLFGTRGNKGLVFDPNESTISEIPIPPGAGEEPIFPKAVGQTLSPYASPTGQPLAFTPGRGLTPVANSPSVGGTPVLKQGNEQAINDAALMQTQAPNIDKLFDTYKLKSPAMARLQATPAGSVIDPEAKQLENSLKLTAFTFGGKNLTGQEKQVVFGAFFPSVTDNANSLEQKRTLLKDYFSGKVDLLQAANLLGPAGVPIRAMLQNKAGTSAPGGNSIGDPEADAAIARVQAANIPESEKKARIAGIRAAAAGQR